MLPAPGSCRRSCGGVCPSDVPCLVGWTLREIWGSQLTWGPNQAGERAGPKTALGELPLLGPLGAPLHPRLQAAGQLPSESGSCSLFQRTDTQHHLVTAENGGGELPPARSPRRGAHCRGSGRQGGLWAQLPLSWVECSQGKQRHGRVRPGFPVCCSQPHAVIWCLDCQVWVPDRVW